MEWVDVFRHRMQSFDHQHPDYGGAVSVSFKVRVTGGCFHREHSPYAYQLIDNVLRSHDLDTERISFIEHESGPEVLAYILLAAGVLNLSAGLINLITAIIKARSEGIKHGDRPNAPVELVIRGFEHKGDVHEEKILIFHAHDKIDANLIEGALHQALKIRQDKPQTKNVKNRGARKKQKLR